MYTREPNENLCIFPTFDCCTFRNVEHINPLKQRDVQEIVNQLSKDKEIREIIVFGSAVEMRCHSRSDLDIFIDKDQKYLDLNYDPITSEIDFLWSCSAGDRLLAEIKRMGVSVYRV